MQKLSNLFGSQNEGSHLPLNHWRCDDILQQQTNMLIIETILFN